MTLCPTHLTPFVTIDRGRFVADGYVTRALRRCPLCVEHAKQKILLERRRASNHKGCYLFEGLR